MKIYTGSGDRGKTSLFSGERIAKHDRRIEAYGDVDELNSLLGGLIAGLPEPLQPLAGELTRIQCDLLDVGAWLATTPGSSAVEMLKPFTTEKVTWLETAIDRLDESLPPLNGFILPGGHLSAATAHVARTVCRRAERHALRVTDAPQDDESAGVMLIYLNRLSDYLFVLARYCNQQTGTAEALWETVRSKDAAP
jgi:cob(I)alamin adenosyltransferase